MADCKVIFLDVDGTITNYENSVPPSAVRAIRLARARGPASICARPQQGRESARNLGNRLRRHDWRQRFVRRGRRPGREHQLITFDQCKRIVDWLHGRGLEFYLESNNGLFASEHFQEAARPVLRQNKLGKGATPEEVDGLEVDDDLHGIVYGAELYRDDLNKVSFILSSYQDHLDSVEEPPDLKAGTWGGKGEHALFGDLGVRGIDKAHAVRVLVEHLGADLADTIAMSDAKVDIPMFETCAQSVCMGSGGMEAKEAADWVTTDVDDDGLWNAFVYLGLIDQE